MTDTESLTGRVAIVTGCRTRPRPRHGRGRAGRRGRVRCHCHRGARAGRTCRSPPRGFPDRVIALRADVTDAADCGALRGGDGRLPLRPPRCPGQQCRARHAQHFVGGGFMTEPTKFWQADIGNAWRTDDRHQRQRAVPDGARGGAGHAEVWDGAASSTCRCSYATMRRRGFSPVRPVESGVGIRNSDLGAGTGRHWCHRQWPSLPGGATATGMIPGGLSRTQLRATLLDPAIMVPPLLYLASTAVRRRHRTALHRRQLARRRSGGRGRRRGLVDPMAFVIASEAKQSELLPPTLDCFVAALLAMTNDR